MHIFNNVYSSMHNIYEVNLLTAIHQKKKVLRVILLYYKFVCSYYCKIKVSEFIHTSEVYILSTK